MATKKVWIPASKLGDALAKIVGTVTITGPGKGVIKKGTHEIRIKNGKIGGK
jgi:hypothetical protein